MMMVSIAASLSFEPPEPIEPSEQADPSEQAATSSIRAALG
ncbi:hypothetical protein [Streptacidiphilus sp. PAMC 29251]